MIVEYKLTGLTVTDEEGRAIGILSELDCIQGVLTALYNEGDPEHSLVGDVMSTEVSTCAPGDSIVAVAQDMLDSNHLAGYEKPRARRRTRISADIWLALLGERERKLERGRLLGVLVAQAEL